MKRPVPVVWNPIVPIHACLGVSTPHSLKFPETRRRFDWVNSVDWFDPHHSCSGSGSIRQRYPAGCPTRSTGSERTGFERSPKENGARRLQEIELRGSVRPDPRLPSLGVRQLQEPVADRACNDRLLLETVTVHVRQARSSSTMLCFFCTV